MDKNKSSNVGLTASQVVLVVLVILKFAGLITWSWFWVLAPLWIDVILLFVVLAGMLIVSRR